MLPTQSALVLTPLIVVIIVIVVVIVGGGGEGVDDVGEDGDSDGSEIFKAHNHSKNKSQQITFNLIYLLLCSK